MASIENDGCVSPISNTNSIANHTIQCDYILSISSSRQEDEFSELVRKAQLAIQSGIYPELIQEGSSGTYFVKDCDGRVLAVFKPKDEEPFAELNPKWPKFFQKILCFCCFGRACLIANNGYISETGASLIDSMLHLNIVPKTRVVKLASPSFYYSRCCGHSVVKQKEGSLQLYMEGFESAQTVFSRWEYDHNLLGSEEDSKFTWLFQKMCVLDYIIRNTDRHLDNLLIRHIPGKELQLAAIDNGLAFPIRHPETASRFRKFPFRWADLKWAKKPWDKSLRDHLLKTITPLFVHDLCEELKTLFSHSSNNSRVLIGKQLRIVRGQLWNLREALRKNDPPSLLSKKEPVILIRRYRRTFPCSNEWSQWFRVKSVEYKNRECC